MRDAIAKWTKRRITRDRRYLYEIVEIEESLIERWHRHISGARFILLHRRYVREMLADGTTPVLRHCQIDDLFQFRMVQMEFISRT